MAQLKLIPTDDAVVFPHMPVTLALDLAEEEQVLLVPRQEGNLASVGTIAQVKQHARLPGGAQAIVCQGVERGVPGPAQTSSDGQLVAEVRHYPDDKPTDGRTSELEREYRAVVAEILDLSGDEGQIASFVQSIQEPGPLADTAGYAPDLSFEQKLKLLETFDVTERLELALSYQRERLSELQVRKRIRDDVDEGAQKQQREYFLRKQLEAIRNELGEGEASVVDEYREKIAEASMPDAARNQADKELNRLERMGEQSAEASMIRTYLDWLVAVPWAKRSDEYLDSGQAREVLDHDHAGLEDVKDRITEYLSVRRLRQDRGITDDRRSGTILTLIGPPGTGKTSVGESIARATGREFVRMSLGGVRDEAEIRGHRRTYIGAMPGRVVRALCDAETINPVVMLDEIDKVGADWRGDPSAALLEVLDPAQNHSFRDHYLDTDLDLSQVFFIATGNVTDTIPPALADRMEMIRFDGYTTEEKVQIGRDYLWPRQRRHHGLREHEVSVAEPTLRTIASDYTREAGVRNLERELATVLRKTATQIASNEVQPPIEIDEDKVRTMLGRPRYFNEVAERTATPGVSTGLAVTGAGGEVLFVEASAMQGKDDLVLTGRLGDVMRESARIALSYVRANARKLVSDPSVLSDREFHLHAPAGAIPKDGPSAGITLATALASLVAQRPVRHEVGMTGEITLQGRVLHVDGIKQKVLAAHAAGLTEVIIPERNRADLDEVPSEVAEQMTFHPVLTLDEVLEIALEPERDVALRQ